MDLNQVFQDYTSETNNDVKDDLLTSTLIEGQYYDMESLITYMNHGIHDKSASS